MFILKKILSYASTNDNRTLEEYQHIQKIMTIFLSSGMITHGIILSNLILSLNNNKNSNSTL